MTDVPVVGRRRQDVRPPVPRDPSGTAQPDPVVLPATQAGRAPLAPVVADPAGNTLAPAGGRLDLTLPAPVSGPTPFVFQMTAGRFVNLPGDQDPHWLAEGGPVEPETLVALLRLAVHDAGMDVWQRIRGEHMSELTIPEVLRLGDRASWVAARQIWEQDGSSLLSSLDDVMSDPELGAIIPHLRGVVPTAELIRVWEGVFSSDAPGVIRALERMPDDEVLGMISDYRVSVGLTGTSADSLTGTIDSVLRGEDDGGYRALRALANRIRRVALASGPNLSPADQQAARDLASELKIKAAFLRINEADREHRPDLAYLAVADLSPVERYYLDSQYLRGWTPDGLSAATMRNLQVLLDSNDDVAVITRALDLSAQQARERDEDENRIGLQVAAEALGPALRRLAERAGDSTLPDSERDWAQLQLTSMAEDADMVGRLLDLPGGEKLVRQGLGLTRSQVARHRALRATSSAELVDIMRGLHSVNVSAILNHPDVKAHLEEEEIEVSAPELRVLDAYAALEGSVPELDLVGHGPLTGPILLGFPGVPAAPEVDEEAPLPSFQMVSAPDPDAPDPLVVVAAYQAFRAANDDDLAGVVSAVRRLRGSQRESLRDEPHFVSALATLRSSTWNDTKHTIADIIADPHEDLSRASEVLVAAGLMGEPGYAYDVSDPRLLAEGLAVDPGDRRMLRYHYVLESLDEEQRASGISGWSAQRTDLFNRGVPAELDIGSDLQTAYGDRMFALDRVEAVPRLRAEDAFLGEPEIMREDISPEEAALEAEFMRIRLKKQLEAASQGIDASGVLGWSPETVTELETEFQRTWERLGAGGNWTHADLVQLAAAYYDALDAIDRNRTERDQVAQFIGSIAATVAGIVVIVVTAGTGTPLAVAMMIGAGLGAGASLAVADQFRDYTSPDQALQDLGQGAVTGGLTVAGQALSNPVGAIVGRQMAGFAARGAVNKALAGAARLAVEGAIDGAIGGAGDAVFATAIDKTTWERGVMAIFARFLSAAAKGAFWGGVTGAVASPVMAGTFAGAGWLLRRLGRELGVVGPEVATGLERASLLADQGRYDMALRVIDELQLTGAQREALTQELYRRALGATTDGAAIPDHMLRELENARQITRGLAAEQGPVRPGEPTRLDLAPVEAMLTRLERELGAAEVSHVRKIIYSEIRLSPEELIVKQHTYQRGLDDAVSELLSPAERAAMPPYEVRVLPPQAFEGMFRSQRGRAITLLEGDRAVVYVRSDAAVRTHMLQEAAHLRQLADPDMAADVRFLSERNVIDWADKTAEDRLHFVDVQQRLEIDAQQRIIAALEKEAPYASGTENIAHELDVAKNRLRTLEAQQAEARAITPDQLAEMNAGIRHRPSWMDEEARLFGEETIENRPVVSQAELRRNPRPVTSSTKLQAGEHIVQLGQGWTKLTYVTSGVDGTVTAVSTVKGATVVTVTPDSGGAPRLYTIDQGGAPQPGIATGARVSRNARLGGWSQDYRLVEVRRGRTAVRQLEEVRNTRGQWVERGSSRTTRGEILEEAAELQEAARLRDAEVAGTVSDWLVVPRGRERRGFDRVFVEFHGTGRSMTAKIRVLEVKEYPNNYVPRAEFTAITDNLADNVEELKLVLATVAADLSREGATDAARALRAAVRATDIEVEVWLGPTTLMGAETSPRSVLADLRTSVQVPGGNVRLAAGGPRTVTRASQQQAITARVAAKGP